MNNLKLSSRLMLLIGVLSALLVVIGGLGLLGISKSNDSLKSVYEGRAVPISQIGNIESMLLGNRLAIAVALVTPTPDIIASSTATVESNIAEITKVWGIYIATNPTAEEGVLAKTFAADMVLLVVGITLATAGATLERRAER